MHFISNDENNSLIASFLMIVVMVIIILDSMIGKSLLQATLNASDIYVVIRLG